MNGMVESLAKKLQLNANVVFIEETLLKTIMPKLLLLCLNENDPNQFGRTIVKE